MRRIGKTIPETKHTGGRIDKWLCLILWSFGFAAVLLSGCGYGSSPEKIEEKVPRPDYEEREKYEEGDNRERLKVVTTVFPYYDFVRQIAGDRVELTLVVPAGMDSHSFEPTPADMRTIQEADILICNGGAMEHWLSQALEAVDIRSMTVVRMMDYVDVVEEEWVEGMEREGHDHGEHGEEEQAYEIHGRKEETHADRDGDHRETEYDEHIWTSPKNAMLLVHAIGDVLEERDLEGKAAYQAGVRAYLQELQRIDDKMEQVAKEQKRNQIVIGDKFPFRYLAEDYGWDYRAAFTGCSTDTEPSARTIAYLIDQVKEEKIPVVYYLELSSHRVAEIIGEETGARPLLLHSCHNVTRREFEAGVTYVELMEQNVENLRKGLVE